MIAVGLFGRLGGVFECGFVLGAFDFLAVFTLRGPVFACFVLYCADLGGVRLIFDASSRRFFGGCDESGRGRTTLPAAS